MTKAPAFDVEAVLATLSLEERVGQMMGAGFEGYEAPAHILDWLRAGRLGTVILFARNVASPSQLADLTASLREAAPLPLMIAIDQEGGIVTRMHAPLFTEAPGCMTLGAAGDPELARRVAGVLAAEMRACGINWNYAPVADVMSNPDNPVIGTRSFGGAPLLVGKLVDAQVQGLQEAGVAACAKHFPGHGNTATDSHLDLPVIETDRAFLDAVDLLPFRMAIEAGVSSIMAGHIRFPALDPENPTTLSRFVLHDLLRGELGFEGVLTTDCMEMRAITDRYGAAESAVLAALAGVDVVLFSHTAERQSAAYNAVLEAARSGRLPAESVTTPVRRILELKARYALPSERIEPLGVASPEHWATVLEAARAGIVLVREESGVLPLRAQDRRRIALIEFASIRENEAADRAGETGLIERLKSKLPGVETAALVWPYDGEKVAQARDCARNADVLVLATRSAHLNPEQSEVADLLIETAPKTVLLCLRNPHDVKRFPTCGTALATLGDTAPSLEAVAEALVGALSPRGGLPLAL